MSNSLLVDCCQLLSLLLLMYMLVPVRVVSSEISSGKFLEFFYNLSRNFRKFVKDFFHFIL